VSRQPAVPLSRMNRIVPDAELQPRSTKPAPVAVVMISLNEGHNMDAVCANVCGWAEQVFLVDSYSRDDTVEIALKYGVHVVQRAFRGFGDQWEFATNKLPITAQWTMKVDPDERLSDSTKQSLDRFFETTNCVAGRVGLRLYFMGRPVGSILRLVRVWRTGKGRWSPVGVNEHLLVDGPTCDVDCELEHHDSPDLDHWVEKQNRYTTAEALMMRDGASLAATPRLLGSWLERRMWLKKHFWKVPLRFTLLFLYNYVWIGAWKAGWPGYAWARLRSDVMRMIEYKRKEMEITGRRPNQRVYGPGIPNPKVPQYD
jgi:hypothetical protein